MEGNSLTELHGHYLGKSPGINKPLLNQALQGLLQGAEDVRQHVNRHGYSFLSRHGLATGVQGEMVQAKFHMRHSVDLTE